VKRVAIIGGGVIGIACAHFLNRAGWAVTVLDKGTIGGACSHGNCGFVCPSHVLPLAEPDAIGKTLASMLKPNAPFRVKPRLDPALFSWLWHFARRCNHRDMVAAGHAIQPLLESSMTLYRDLVRTDGIECEWQERGLLFVYQTREALEAYAPTNRLLAEEFHEPAKRLDGDEVQKLEPALKPGLAGGWYYEHDAHLRADRLMASWKRNLTERGVTFHEQCEFLGFTGSTVRTSLGEIPADAFVVAAGAWTPLLAQHLGVRVPIEPGKGYSITMPRPAICPNIPMLFPEHRVGVTPMQTGYRLGSIMEFAGYDESISPKRLALLTDGAAHYLQTPQSEPIQEKWFGWRPMTWDSLPIIDRSPAHSNVFLAVGHNMLGLSMAPATGKLIAEMITGSAPHIEPHPYRVSRF
jgi:D-amino-acid dehydrogenase